MSHFPIPVSVEPNLLPVGASFGRNAVVRPRTLGELSAYVATATDLGHCFVSESGAPAYNPATIRLRLRGAIVIKLDAFRDVQARPDGTVTVGAAVTVGDLVAAVRAAGLLLPVPDLPHDTVVDALRSGVQSIFSRSTGTLASRVTAATLVLSDGTVKHAVPGADDALIRDALSAIGDDEAYASTPIVVSLSFRAISASQARQYWLASTAFVYETESFSSLLADMAAGFACDMPDTADILVQTMPGTYGVPVVMVSISGIGAHDQCPYLAAVKTAVLRALEKPTNATGVFQVFRGAAIGDQIISAGEMGHHTHGKDTVPMYRVFTAEEATESVVHVAEAIEKTVASNRRSLSVSSSTRISSNERKDLEVFSYVFLPSFMSDTDKHIESIVRNVFASTAQQKRIDFSCISDSFTAPIVSSSLTVKESDIPSFEGNTYMRGDIYYEDRAHQYATSSYPAADMAPYMVAYPFNEADITAAINFAKSFEKQKNVIGRSGGHQYSGLSSGGDDTIVLSMDYFNEVNRDLSSPNVVTAGVGVRLTHIADVFKAYPEDNKPGVTVPHGECPLVAVGGHSQSGGYGHLLRSYGLIVDFVQSFRIVTGDGVAHSIYKPGVEGIRTHPRNDDVFFAVLGGGPSSFGILTEITYNAIKDEDHPYSAGLSARTPYGKEAFEVIVRELQKRTIAICDGDTLQGDDDMMASAISFDINNYIHGTIGKEQPEPETFDNSELFPSEVGKKETSSEAKINDTELELLPKGVLLLELVYGDHDASEDKMNSTMEKYRELYNDVKSKLPSSTKMDLTPSIDGKTPLSVLSDSFVRRFGMGKDGREFPYPYQKRLNGSFNPLTDGFVRGFVDLCSEVMEDRRVRLVFQVCLGGSQHRHGGIQNGKAITGCSRRECSIAVIFDVFYTSGHKNIAQHYQEKMGELLDREFTEKQSVRFLWGSFGNTEIKEVWQYYYDNADLYKKLQSIKADVDPKDVFHTRFNVQLTSNHQV